MHPTFERRDVRLDIWTVPFVIVVLIIISISVVSVWKWNKAFAVISGQDIQTAAENEDHPFKLNPIIWIALTALFFILIVIFYYAASS